MRFLSQSTSFYLSLVLFLNASLLVVAQDAAISSIVSEVDSLKSGLLGLSTASNAAAAASSLGGKLDSLLASVTTESYWPAASSIIASQASTDSRLSNLPYTTPASSTASAAVSSASAAVSSASAAVASAQSSGLAPMATAGLGGLVAAAAAGVLGAAVLL